jgi:hypothetical protein
MSQLDVTTSNETTGAGVIDSWHSFASSIEDIKTAHGGDKAAVAVEIGITGASAVLDTVAFALDPLAKLISAGLGWLIEHVKFLRWPLDQIAGDPDKIKELADSLHTIGENLRNTATDFDTALKNDITQWQGQAADQFTSVMNGHKTHIDDSGHSVDTVGYVVETTMALIAAVRALFRDIITTVLGDIIATMLIALAAAVFTFGASIAVGVTKCVVEGTVQAASMAAKLAKVGELAGRTAARIKQLTGMTGGAAGNAGHELDDIPTTTGAGHDTGAGAGAAGHTDDAPPAHVDDTPPPTRPANAGDDAPPVHTDDAPPAHTDDPEPTTQPADEGAPGDPDANSYDDQDDILNGYHDDPEGAPGNPNANSYDDQDDILNGYHDDPEGAPGTHDDPEGAPGTNDDPEGAPSTHDGSDDSSSTHSDPDDDTTTPNDFPPQQGNLDDPPPSPTGSGSTHSGDTSSTHSGEGDEEGAPPSDHGDGTPHDDAPADPPPAPAPKPPDPKSPLKDQDISLLKKHEDWLKNNFKESQAKAKFVDNWVKKNAPDSYPLVKAMSDAKSSKNWVGWVDKSAVQVDKQLTDIQTRAQDAWDQSDEKWRQQHPDPAAAATS